MHRSKWYNHHFCVNCHQRLTKYQKMYSDGRCPYCGFKRRGAGTIVETYEKAAQYVITKPVPWWKIWEKQEGHWEYSE